MKIIAESSKISYNYYENRDKNSQIYVKLLFIIYLILWKENSYQTVIKWEKDA